MPYVPRHEGVACGGITDAGHAVSLHLLQGVTAVRIVYFTPTHNPRYMDEAYGSLRDQIDTNWEWVVLLNGGAEWECSDVRVHIVKHLQDRKRGIGELKRYAATYAIDVLDADVVAELDHDDLLHPDCTRHLRSAFEQNRDIGFVYSDTARFCDDGSKPVVFSEEYGWLHAWELSSIPTEGLQGKRLWVQPSFDPSPQSLARIWYAPDHIRAWRSRTYLAAGGHDTELDVCDDYDLLMRTYLVTDFHRINMPLYAYRHHPGGTSAPESTMNKRIQDMQFQLGNKYRVQIAEAWAKRCGLLMLDICSGPRPAAGYTGIDKQRDTVGAQAGGDVWLADLDRHWELGDNSVGVVRAQDALEHLKDKDHTMREIHRVLAHGGWLFSDTPSTDGRGAFQDPTHVSYWNSNSFWYYTSRQHEQFLPGHARPHFQMWHLENLHYNDFNRQHDIVHVRAHMSAVKPGGVRLPGPYDYKP